MIVRLHNTGHWNNFTSFPPRKKEENPDESEPVFLLEEGESSQNQHPPHSRSYLKNPKSPISRINILI